MNAPDLPTRILSKIKFGKCWTWQAYCDPDGYGRIHWKGKSALAHRVVYELLVGIISAGLTLDHKCRNRACVRPAHMDVVTLAGNKERGFSPSMVNKRKVKCPRGHRYDYAGPSDGKRKCRRCQTATQRERREASRA